ncbi:dioxygenase [Rhodobacteraceae bacterium CCMM004]|nr:dioxygenase [Rhodobacteraceae bacterium CCMM004]
MADRMPALFVSHGAPSLVLEDCPAHHFLKGLGRTIPRPTAIVVMSAHYEADTPTVSGAAAPETTHDFRGFPVELYAMRYRAPGAPAVADRIADLLRAARFDAAVEPERGFDHGVWVPLTLIYPGADIPVVSLSIQPQETPRHHSAIGRALSPLRDEGILLIGSGSMTHNLERFFAGGYDLNSPAEPFAREFADWIADRIAEGRTDALIAAPDTWPGGRENHPTDDHILPFYFALGAGGEACGGRRLHRSTNYGVLAMDAFAFG